MQKTISKHTTCTTLKDVAWLLLFLISWTYQEKSKKGGKGAGPKIQYSGTIAILSFIFTCERT